MSFEIDVGTHNKLVDTSIDMYWMNVVLAAEWQWNYVGVAWNKARHSFTARRTCLVPRTTAVSTSMSRYVSSDSLNITYLLTIIYVHRGVLQYRRMVRRLVRTFRMKIQPVICPKLTCPKGQIAFDQSGVPAFLPAVSVAAADVVFL